MCNFLRGSFAFSVLLALAVACSDSPTGSALRSENASISDLDQQSSFANPCTQAANKVLKPSGAYTRAVRRVARHSREIGSDQAIASLDQAIAAFDALAVLHAVMLTECQPVPPDPEVCDGVDNDGDGQADEGLFYCVNGSPAANTNGENSCLPGFSDEDGLAFNGCESALDAGIVVRLTWETPNDPDQTDEDGTDMDLHLLHPSGTWLDSQWDAYSGSPNPDWGVAGEPSDDPLLDANDTDGAGPEVITLAVPESGNTYRVGVHYTGDNGFGPSWVTVSIFVNGVLVFENAPVSLSDTDYFLQVADIDWPSGTVTSVNVVTPSIP
jgi:hypothetical protein